MATNNIGLTLRYRLCIQSVSLALAFFFPIAQRVYVHSCCKLSCSYIVTVFEKHGCTIGKLLYYQQC